MDVQEVISSARDAVTVKRVYGEPFERDGVTVIPAANVTGGGGGGGGADQQGNGGDGAGFGINARPAGAFVIRDGQVAWKPAVNVNRIILGAQVVGIVALLAARAILSNGSGWRRGGWRRA